MADKIPPFDALPLQKSGPFYNAWGLFGENDEMGMLNLLTPETTKEAAKEIKEGIRISLDWHLDKPVHPFFNRQVFFHHIQTKAPRTVNDDVLLFNTQCSTQWDGFRHFGYQKEKRFFQNTTQEQIETSTRIGINVWVEHGGIVGRGVLLDFASWAEKKGINVEVFKTYPITAAHLRELVSDEKIEIRPGDIIFIRSGFTKQYEELSAEAEKTLPQRRTSELIGVESDIEFAKWLWENKCSAIAGDMPGFEQNPLVQEPLHQILLGGWGMPIGEMFYLEELAKECKKLGRYSFFLSSVPLKVPGGVASPPNAVAIL